MRCLFASDLHGHEGRTRKLLQTAMDEGPDGVFIGGDILPSGYGFTGEVGDFLDDFFNGIEKVKRVRSETRFFVIMGNDDPRVYEKEFLDAGSKGSIEYVQGRCVPFDDHFVCGYPYIPPSPYMLKDWERYDVSRFVEPGCASPEEGQRSVEVPENEKRFRTIREDLEELAGLSDPGRTIYLFHSPPYQTPLDRAELDGRMVEHAPLDVHIGSIAIKRFIEEHAPLLTLHGHVHESTRLTGRWRCELGTTACFSGAHDGDGLALVRFDPDDLASATRGVIALDRNLTR